MAEFRRGGVLSICLLCIYSLSWPSGPIQAQSRDVWMSFVFVLVCAIAENPLPGGLETSGQRVYH